MPGGGGATLCPGPCAPTYGGKINFVAKVTQSRDFCKGFDEHTFRNKLLYENLLPRGSQNHCFYKQLSTYGSQNNINARFWPDEDGSEPLSVHPPRMPDLI